MNNLTSDMGESIDMDSSLMKNMHRFKRGFSLGHGRAIQKEE